MTRTRTITVVVVSDDNYMILLAALVRSIEAHLGGDVKMDLWIVADKVPQRSRKKMAASSDPQVTTLHWIDINDAVDTSRIPIDKSTYPKNIYARLFIPYFIPKNVEKVLYLDVDMIVLKDLATLLDTDMSGHVVAAVTDARIKTFDNHWGGILNYEALGLKGGSKYFNTGLLIMDTHKWLEQDMTDKVVNVIKDNVTFANYPDQYGLNIALADDWLELAPEWNHFSVTEGGTPYIIHFIERKPIYKSYKNSIVYKQHFDKYLAMTAWKGTRPIGESTRYVAKLKNVISKVFK